MYIPHLIHILIKAYDPHVIALPEMNDPSDSPFTIDILPRVYDLSDSHLTCGT